MENTANANSVTITIDSEQLTVPEGITVAAAVLGHGHIVQTYINPVDGSPRAPYCQMGVCFECLMEIDGEPNVQSCLVSVREGMAVKRQLQPSEMK